MGTLETDKLGLIQKLNDALVQLDKLNQEKLSLSNKLIELLKFIREISRETQKADGVEALGGVVSQQVRDELRQEKERTHHIKEELKRAELERMRLLERLGELGVSGEDLEIRQGEYETNLQSRVRTYEEVEEEFREAGERITQAEKDSEELRARCI